MLQSNRKNPEFSLQQHLGARLTESLPLQERLADEHKGLVLLVAIVSLVALLILGVSGYLAVQKYQAEKAALVLAEREAAAAEAAARAMRAKQEQAELDQDEADPPTR